MKTLLTGIMVLLLGCGGSKEILQAEEQMQASSSKKPVIEMGYEQKTDPYKILNATVEGNTLLVEVEYGGGCRDHVFELFTDGLVMKSLPPKQYFYLRHYANEDMCKALLTETLSFDLSGSAAMGNSLVLLLEGYKGDLRMEF